MQRLYFFLIFILSMLVISCENDDFTTSDDEEVELSVSLSVTSTAASRAWDGTQSENLEDEKMKSWFVVIVNSKNEIEKILEKSDVNDLEKDEYGKVRIHKGEHKFYSFANISPADVIGNRGVGDEMPDLSSTTYTVNGIDYNRERPDSGIPMSNVQTIDIDSQTEIDLWVVRMVAKMELMFTNDMGHDVIIDSIRLSNITADADNNILLLPNPLNEGDSVACKPNLPTGLEKVDFVVAPELTIANGETKSLTYYLNESDAPTTPQSRFLLTLSLSYDGKTDEKRYALISNEEDNWDFIARNDYRILPITLDDYTLDLLPYDFTPIGVYPTSVVEEDGLFTVTFHHDGHFHLQPIVTKRSTGTHLTFGTGWFFSSWKLNPDDNPLETNDNIYKESTDTSDTGDNGGTPVWDELNGYVFGYLNGTSGKAYHELIVSVDKGNTSISLPYRIMVVAKME